MCGICVAHSRVSVISAQRVWRVVACVWYVCVWPVCGNDLLGCQFVNKQTSLLGQGSVDGDSCESSEENIIEGETNASKHRLTH